MNYENDDALRAPVWDDLNQNENESTTNTTASGNNNNFNFRTDTNLNISHDTIDGLSQTFANIGTSDHFGDDSNEAGEKNTSEGDKLINLLAPEDNLLADIEKDVVPGVMINGGSGDLLFGGSPSLISPILGNEALKLNSNETSPSKRTSKPHSLFNASTRLRRRKPNYGNATTENGKPQLVKDTNNISDSDSSTQVTSLDDDPLGKAQKENEFVEEPLEYDNNKRKDVNGNISKASLLNQMDEPLYKLSPRKFQPTSNANAEISGNNSNKISKKDKTNIGTPDQDQSDTQVPDAVPFKIDVTDPIKVGDLTSAHIEYTVNSVSELLDSNQSQVTRRYTDFRWLYRQLQSNHWGKVIPPPPEKQAVGRFKRDFIENRRFQMETMLKRIAHDSLLQRDQDFLMFLKSEQFSNDSKLRAYATASGSYNDNNDLSEVHMSEVELLGPDDAAIVLNNGGIDAEQNKGFMNFSLTSQPKYNEPDQYYIQERERFVILEEQLKQLYRSLELIDTERNELAATVFEFSKSIEVLAKLEVTRKSSDLLNSFAELHNSIRESLERNSLQQSLTLGVTLDEYIRTLSSVRAIFNQRAKLGYFLVVVEGDLRKKKAQFDKTYPDFKPSAPIKDEHCRTMLGECLVLDKRYNAIKEKWTVIADNIKREIKHYEVEKIEEFRNSMEISLESSIESQKEFIELWETFYQNNL
ncbi:similar to Saccharomyces cerevisiae YOR069W VPS5 Nexin-1 homolog required for localizing membrane proteins from a prevacuolar/late endosomal compartment back to the late Golgi apparatus [Maudiozyma barnettii]|uniref:Similar to Saccharomyces cerevisiae YOR069W VPS5 Nexin-1 homolog required for localizing membrane proteins from a prevacuolar/late endosomal compartment back to the late Golgi apparatus n=1 Tax=Maudiozyma barnettii TaxID=61262 RepID=A0A8H2ZIU7_9SACH|nr:sorting nexin 1 [Kazachstania barnettii]CAB4256268.1 similar to Saccharomyces cerevisiae YOR069W VPS5 Nexin-1 homolog required for localizing membrane proteins from a prevacuolar/late endosomal compartment back to the late Golgi apparatus [Kazachstania barnettii]CAD1784877.1 similar to Saccharomyces cerevisiae YOR069W VPS5 Nexin-1 homolog required for localizing membrane proteins from a prevacuolar/late endosomal compartment back to the late Golgi apparatus [Kazachstania barnettii]